MKEGENFNENEISKNAKIKENEKIDKIAYKYNPNYEAVYK